MRILFWSEQFWPSIGGIEVWGAGLLQRLQKRGHAFAVIAAEDHLASDTQNVYAGVSIYRFPFWTALADRKLGQLLNIKRAVAELKDSFASDLVHLNLTGPSVYFHLQTAGSHPAPLLVSLHQPLEEQSGRSASVVSRVLRSSDWITGGSNMVLDTARQLAPETTARSSLIRFGFDAPDLVSQPLPLEEPRLLCLGRLVYEKGFDLVLTAFASLVKRFPRLRLIIGSDGPARPALERQSHELALADVVDFIGWVDFDKMPALFNSATVVVMPSRVIEGFGFVALEAAMMGRPVVATRSGGLSEAVIDGHTGLLVERENSQAIAAAIAYLLDHPDIAVKMGQAAQWRARESFNWERHVDAYDALYRRLRNEFVNALRPHI
jgi:glycogen(starch) synthase